MASIRATCKTLTIRITIYYMCSNCISNLNIGGVSKYPQYHVGNFLILQIIPETRSHKSSLKCNSACYMASILPTCNTLKIRITIYYMCWKYISNSCFLILIGASFLIFCRMGPGEKLIKNICFLLRK